MDLGAKAGPGRARGGGQVSGKLESHLQKITTKDVNIYIKEALSRIINKPAEPDSGWQSSNPDPSTSNCPWKIYNIGNSNPVNLMKYINAIEKHLNKKAIIDYLPLQPGDVPSTHADVSSLVNDFNYHPKTNIEDGIKKFINWYKDFYKEI